MDWNLSLAEGEWTQCRKEIIESIQEFDRRNPNAASLTGSKFFIGYKGRTYPPKDIRSIVEGDRPKIEFSGGKETNQMFRNLGFNVLGNKFAADYRKGWKQPAKENCCWDELKGQIKALFNNKWTKLEGKPKTLQENLPGIYLLAFGRGLENRPVVAQDVAYVGMSTSSLRVRLQAFWEGIDDGIQHSGAMRFYRDWAGGKSIRNPKLENEFYVATHGVSCTPSKGLRMWTDLETLGTVVALEYLAIAKIKRDLDLEPPLNKK